MKSNSLINPRSMLVAVCGAGLALGFFASLAQADMMDRKTVLTVNEPIQVRDKLLQPGQYVLKLLNTQSNLHIVQIFNGDQSQIIDTVLAIPAYRNEPTGDTKLTFWETPPGTAKALRQWFYPGDNMGQEFPYPKQLAMLEKPPAPPEASAPAPVPPPEAAPAPPPMPPAPPQPQEMTPAQPPVNEEPQSEAQPPQPPATPPQPAEPQTPTPDTSANRSAELPHTSSPYTVVGAMGLLCLGIFGALRLKRAVKS